MWSCHSYPRRRPQLPTFHDGSGRAITLGRELGRGGEGAVYEVAGAPDVVAKVYAQPIDRSKAAKLQAMAQGATPALLRIAAWPTSPLVDGGRTRGLLMPRVTGYREVHQLYGPKARRMEFPHADWGFLVHAARNVAAAVETVHAHGHVIADVNQGNIVIGRDATVKLIDCDSFQISVNGTRYLCEVGVAHFTPPELHNHSFAGVVRTPNHDAFGLAVAIFHLLFFGRHPFAGRFQGKGDMPIERAITEYRFAYSQSAATRHMLPPPNTLPLTAVSFGLASLFERAFATGSERGGRPTATEWRTALEMYAHKPRACSVSPAHWYHASLSRCPICELERAIGADFFLVAVSAGGGVGLAFDVDALWRRIQATPPPEVPAALVPAVPAATGQPLPAGVRTTRIAGRFSGIAGIIAGLVGLAGGNPLGIPIAVGLLIAWFILRQSGGYAASRAERRARLQQTTSDLDAAVNRTKQTLDEARRRFSVARQELERARDQYKGIPVALQNDLQALVRQREATQRKHFLERYFIAHADIRGIGDGLKATLASYGVETAADVSWGVQQVPGFGPKRAADLMSWRQAVEASFRFDPARGVDAADEAAVRSKYQRMKQDLERQLRAGPAELQRFRELARHEQERARAPLIQLATAVAQAKADAQAVA
jgi:DNA-binding helix-hairpin-helix protein with protein kinase domain